MTDPAESMVELGHASTPTPWTEIGRSEVSAERVHRFLIGTRDGAEESTPLRHAPLSFALVLRRGHGPEVAISPKAFGIHGGHDIELLAPILVGQHYVVSARVERIYRKTGRSGPMTVIERRVRIDDQQGQTTGIITDRQVLRWKPSAGGIPVRSRSTKQPGPSGTTAALPQVDQDLEVGEIVGPWSRKGPTREEISGWADALRDREPLFHDRGRSDALGYADLVVPGPMQSAFVDHLLAAALGQWRATRLNMTFRQSLLADERLEIEATVVEAEGESRTAEIVIRNAASGETTSVGTATLARK